MAKSTARFVFWRGFLIASCIQLIGATFYQPAFANEKFERQVKEQAKHKPEQQPQQQPQHKPQQQPKQQVKPSKMLATYAGMFYGKHANNDKEDVIFGGCPNGGDSAGLDLDCLIQQIINSRSNTYYYAFSPHSYTHWNRFGPFLEKLYRKNPNIKVYALMVHSRWLLPFAYCPLQGPCKYAPSKANKEWVCDWKKPNKTDLCQAGRLGIWAQALAKLALKHPNLAGMSIDDFDMAHENGSSAFYNPETLRTMRQHLEPKGLKLLVTAYYKDKDKYASSLLLNDKVLEKYQLGADKYLFDGVNFAVLITSNHRWAGLKDDNISDFARQIAGIKNHVRPGLKIMTLLYATGYHYCPAKNRNKTGQCSALAALNTSSKYLDEVGRKALELTDGVIMYHLLTDFMDQGAPGHYKVQQKRAVIQQLYQDFQR